jgi:hypothetical protein
VCFLNIIVVIGFISIMVVIVVVFVVVIINIAIGIVVIITHVVGLMVISSVELIAFLIIIVGMPIALSSHGLIALNTVLLGLTLTTDQSLLELGCFTCARRVSDDVALATHMKLTVGSLLSMTNYLAELAEIRAVLGAMIVTTRSADHRQRISVIRSESFTNRFSLQIVLRGLANPPGSVDVIPTAGCAQCAWCSLLTIVRAFALGALF